MRDRADKPLTFGGRGNLKKNSGKGLVDPRGSGGGRGDWMRRPENKGENRRK